MPSKGMQMLEMSDIMMDTVPVAEDGEDESQQLVPRTVNHAKFDKLDDQLKVPVGSVPPVKAPKSTSDGELCGWLMHQGKYRGAWKKAYFVLKQPYLFQYEKEDSKSPKKAYFVSFVVSDKMAAEALAEETAAKYMVKLEEKACSLRINVFTPGKTKVITAASEETMQQWVEKLDACVRESCKSAPGAYESKAKAADAYKPLMLAQSFNEVDQYQTLVKNLVSAGLMAADDDPRHSDDVAKAGKMKMLKSKMDENVWQKFYFVLVGKTIYYYASRKKSGKANYDDKDDEDEDEDDEDENDMPWKGCFDVTVATVNQAPSNISTKAKVFQIKTPLRTFILKARHEVDAEDWMAQICAAQQGIPVEQREAKLRGYDVYNDKLVDKLNSKTVQLYDVLKHPVAVRYFIQYLTPEDQSLAKLVKCFKSIEKFRSKVVPSKKHKKALKIFKKFVKSNEHIPKALQGDLADQVEQFDFAQPNMFQGLEEHLVKLYSPLFEDFRASDVFKQLEACLGPKKVTVSSQSSGDKHYKLDGTIMVGRSRENESGDGYIHLADDHKVSREHCKIDAGPLAVVVTDLGSSKGTKFQSKDGKKIMAKVILPGQSIYIGGYVLTLGLGDAPKATGKKSGGGGFFSMFSKKKK